MASIRKRGKVWCYAFIGGDGIRRERAGCSDKRETERMASAAEAEAAKVRAGFVDARDLALKDHAKAPLAQHLRDWEASMTAKGLTPRHVGMFAARVNRLVAMVAGASAAETERSRAERHGEKAREFDAKMARLIAPARLGDLTAERVQKALGALRDSGASLQTLNHHRAAIRAFDLWLFDSGRTRESALRSVRGYNAKEDRRHDRRTIGLEELQRLIETAHQGPARAKVPGPVRALAYRLAVASGLRYSELRSIRPESFDWRASPPTVRIAPAYEKTRKEAVIPLADDLASDLKPLAESVPRGEPVFPLPKDKGAKLLRFDLERAGIPYVDDSGLVFDFHAQRCTTATLLDQAGVSPRVAQRVMRHATPGLTDRYTRPRAIDVEAAALSVPSLKPEADKPDASILKATGTEGSSGQAPTPQEAEECTDVQPISKVFAAHLPHGGRVLTRDHSDSCAMTDSHVDELMKGLEAQNTGFCGSVRDDSGGSEERRRPDSNRGWRFCRPLPYHLATAPGAGGGGECSPSPRQGLQDTQALDAGQEDLGATLEGIRRRGRMRGRLRGRRRAPGGRLGL